ncbi:dihydroorotate dehydrogenase electron transfer subunit [Anaerovorax odorimutans]|uniref:Dihydroorotate dehydrogenase B (NAD(+)), electron transfer subunit n=1 Tax=Anaerovorax odorimutans TaxID=109327 RepID=A0ABT1RSE1_9FIRM|nr:dihydroorotate dehydrogenase electron transfer subunit [Anaerovorax odorimutans]MCQ4638128.1 dihydroorotate dehydrogenase electron transfer subunit [Anaerovorax odorimutans]
MKTSIYKIQSNRALRSDIYEMKLKGDTSSIKAPGQFVNIKIEGLYLRRPISICDWDQNQLTIIYKVVGEGTERMARMAPGQELDILGPLGNGYDLDKIEAGAKEKRPLLIGGGVGIPPMYGLAKALLDRKVPPEVILGFNKSEEIFYEKEFKDLGVDVKVTTANGSYGIEGFVTDATKNPGYVCACGPEPMLKAVWDKAENGQFSFEARMACGFGGCMGCSCQTKYGAKRICKEGPVLEKEEILW